MAFGDFGTSNMRETIRLFKPHKSQGIGLFISTSASRQNQGICANSPLLPLYYNKLYQKNQEFFSKIVLTVQSSFNII